MTTLHRKLLRDLRQLWAQGVAIALVVAVGIAALVAMVSVYRSLDGSRERYYAEARFGEVFASLRRAPRAVAPRIAELPGVAAVEARIARGAVLDVPGLREPAQGKLVSLPRHGRPALGDLFLREGRFPLPGRAGEAVVNEAFAVSNGFRPGDTVGAVVGGHRLELILVGIVLSPEYVYQIAPGSLFPDDRRFGVFWLDEEYLAAAVDMEGAFDDVAVKLSPGASEKGTIEALDRLLAPYGSAGAYGRDLQPSARYVDEELKQLERMSTRVPLIFLGVAVFLLHVVLSRLVAGQREEIAVLKALGYSGPRIGAHFLELTLVVVLAGAGAGALLGGAMGRGVMGAYRAFFRFPELRFELQADVLLAAVAAGLLAGVAAAGGAVWRVVRMPPAEAMRPPVPPVFRRGGLERLGLFRFLPPAARMVVRTLGRRPVQTLLSAVGIAMGMAILIVVHASLDGFDYLMEVSLERAQRQDVTVTFFEPRGPEAVGEVARLPGVLHAEPVRSLPVRLRNGPRSYETTVEGIEPGGTLRRLLDPDLRTIAAPPEGVVLTRELGRRLGAGAGERLLVEVLEGERPVRWVPVAGLVDEMLGMNAYMELGALARLSGEGPRVTGALALVDPAREDELFARVKHLPGIAGVNLRRTVLEVFRQLTGAMMGVTSAILALFAGVIAVGVIYNGARITLAERSRELASLRVLGFTRREISAIFLGELGAYLLLALPLGCLFGYLFTDAVSRTARNEMYRLPTVIDPATYLLAAAVVTAASLATALWVRRRLDHLDLVAVLKTRE